jgi:hypothetical protein
MIIKYVANLVRQITLLQRGPGWVHEILRSAKHEALPSDFAINFSSSHYFARRFGRDRGVRWIGQPHALWFLCPI